MKIDILSSINEFRRKNQVEENVFIQELASINNNTKPFLSTNGNYYSPFTGYKNTQGKTLNQGDLIKEAISQNIVRKINVIEEIASFLISELKNDYPGLLTMGDVKEINGVNATTLYIHSSQNEVHYIEDIVNEYILTDGNFEIKNYKGQPLLGYRKMVGCIVKKFAHKTISGWTAKTIIHLDNDTICTSLLQWDKVNENDIVEIEGNFSVLKNTFVECTALKSLNIL